MFAVTTVTFPSIRFYTVGVLFAHIAVHVLLGHLTRLVSDRPVQNHRHPLLGYILQGRRREVEVVVHGNKGEAAWIEVMDIGMVVVTAERDVDSSHVPREAGLAASDAQT